MLSRNCCERAGIDSTPASGPARSPAKKFRPTRRTPASPTALTNASTAASSGTGSPNGHQNSTAPKPADRAAAGPLQEGQLGEHYRAVRQVPQRVAHRGLSVDGNLLSLCEYVRPLADPPSTVARRPPSTVARRPPSTVPAARRARRPPPSSAGGPTASLHRAVSLCGRPSSHLTDLGHDHVHFVPVCVTNIRGMSAAARLTDDPRAVWSASARSPAQALAYPRPGGAGSSGRGPRGPGR